MQLTQTYAMIFYVILTIILGVIGYRVSDSGSHMMNTSIGVVAGIVISLALWYFVGSKLPM